MRRHSGCDPNERYKSIYAAWEMHSHLSAIKAAIDFFDKLPEATLRAEKREHIRQWLGGKLQPPKAAPVYQDIPMDPPPEDPTCVIGCQTEGNGYFS
jgi:hypothetical protein